MYLFNLFCKNEIKLFLRYKFLEFLLVKSSLSGLINIIKILNLINFFDYRF